jgi:hypothetical protein
MYQHIANSLFSRASSTSQIILVGLRVLEIARQSSTCIDLPYTGALITRDGIFTIHVSLLTELTESVRVFSATLDKLLLSCSDTAIRASDFLVQLEEFTNNAVHLRDDYLKTILEIETSGVVGYNCLPLVPLGTAYSVTFDQNGKRVTNVRELPNAAELDADFRRMATDYEETMKKRPKRSISRKSKQVR